MTVKKIKPLNPDKKSVQIGESLFDLDSLWSDDLLTADDLDKELTKETIKIIKNRPPLL